MMLESKSGIIALIIITIALYAPLAQGATGWRETEEEGDQHFEQGSFRDAAKSFNESGQLALFSGQPSDAKRIFSKLGNCFSDDRINDPQLLREYVNSTAFAYLLAAEEENFGNASDYIRRAGYLFGFHDYEEYLPVVIEKYSALVLNEVDTTISASEEAISYQRWDIAGMNYMDAGIMLHSLENESSDKYFELAAENLIRGAEAEMAISQTSNYSRAGDLYRLAALSGFATSIDTAAVFQSSGDAYSQAAEELLIAGEPLEATDNLIMAAEMYQRANLPELSVENRIEAAEILEELGPGEDLNDYLLMLQAGIQYDLGGLHRRASIAYATAANPEIFPFDMAHLVPRIQLELLEILGRGRRTNRARAISDLILSQNNRILAFFGAPTFGAYDIMGELGPGIVKESADNFLYSTYVTESLMVASSFLINLLPEEAMTIIESIPQEILIIDPGNKAFYEVISSALQVQRGSASPSEVSAKRGILVDLYQGFLVSSLDDILPSPIYVSISRRKVAVEMLLNDLDFAVSNDEPTELLYSRAQELNDELVDSRARNLTGHLELVDIWGTIGRRASHQGDLNGSAEVYQLAAFHSCAGEDFQGAILYRDVTFGMVDADTPLSAASYITADAMLSQNQTLKEEAGDYILSNLSIYIGDLNTNILISVLEGRTQLEVVSSITRMAGLGFIATFILITSYVILIWEPKTNEVPREKEEGPRDDVQEDLDDMYNEDFEPIPEEPAGKKSADGPEE